MTPARAVAASALAAWTAFAVAQPVGVELRLDNDQFAFTPGERERWYSHGGFFGVGFVPAPDAADARLLSAACDLLPGCDPGARVLRVLSLGQTIHTPASTQVAQRQPDDRPYAATLAGEWAAIAHGPTARRTLALRLGVVGPAALGEPVQNAIHRLIGEPPARGWPWQVRAQPLVEIGASQLLRVALPLRRTDTVLRAAAQVGVPVTQASLGAMLRGGPGATEPAWPGESALPEVPTGWRVFAGAQLRAVAYDATIEGGTYGVPSRVTRAPWVGEAFAGIALPLADDWGVEATVVRRSVDFDVPQGAPRAGPQRFGMVSLRWRPRR